MKYVGYAVSWLVVIVLGSIFYGFALATLWGWFVVPALHAPALTVPQAIGLSLVVSMFTSRQVREKKDTDTESAGGALLTSSVVAVIVPLLWLTMGFLVHLFV